MASYNTPEYRTTIGLTQIRAAEAYALRISGQEGGAGKAIGIIDTGIDATHLELRAALERGAVFDMNASGQGDKSHGTGVAGVAAAARDGSGTMGVAFNAALIDYDAGTDDNQISGRFIDAINQSAIAPNLQAGRADVLNMSFGIQQDLGAQTRDAMVRASNAGQVLVVSAGNNSATETSWLARFVIDPGVAGMGIAVAAGTSSGLAGYSDSCGMTADYCLVAPGTTMSTTVGGGYAYFSGTSSAAPTVAGAYAVLAAAFPNLSPRDIVQRMLETADPIPGCPPARCGQGFLNLEKAMGALGSVSIASTSGESRHEIGQTYAFSGGAISTQAIEKAMMDVLVVDEGGAAFRGNLSGKVGRAGGADLQALMSRDNSWMSQVGWSKQF